jgi:hypothetical protein
VRIFPSILLHTLYVNVIYHISSSPCSLVRLALSYQGARLYIWHYKGAGPIIESQSFSYPYPYPCPHSVYVRALPIEACAGFPPFYTLLIERILITLTLEYPFHYQQNTHYPYQQVVSLCRSNSARLFIRPTHHLLPFPSSPSSQSACQPFRLVTLQRKGGESLPGGGIRYVCFCHLVCPSSVPLPLLRRRRPSRRQ